MSPDTNSTAIFSAINNAAKKISAIGISKDRKNLQQGYSFRGIDDVYNIVGPILADCGVTIIPTVEDRRCEWRATRNGTEIAHVTLKIRWSLYAVDGSSITACTVGTAMDSGDKADNKAMSAAYKYMVFMVFAVPVDTPDADETTPPDTITMSSTDVRNLVNQDRGTDKFIKAMLAEKARLGDGTYYAVLGALGYSDENEVSDRKARVDVYNALKAASPEVQK